MKLTVIVEAEAGLRTMINRTCDYYTVSQYNDQLTQIHAYVDGAIVASAGIGSTKQYQITVIPD